MSDRRPLTPGEIDLARSMFGGEIDYARVEIVRRKWWPLQPRGVVMAPTGNIHFHPQSERYSDDFSKENLGLQGLFIHEMTHVWQTQRGGRWFLPLARHPFCRYAYEVKPGRPFDRYGLEQQAELVRHLFLRQRGRKTPRDTEIAVLGADFLPFRGV
ncbi:vgr related protein [Sphingomicrobium nitratireducens]|uniref:vgr related protein n=1 Tax=Sphingomicrobium nitratireducens TaxID=2964666 RepID=UPI0022405B8A|nr:vgr related protein [Sphingomicrobium nitratireducens]